MHTPAMHYNTSEYERLNVVFLGRFRRNARQLSLSYPLRSPILPNTARPPAMIYFVDISLEITRCHPRKTIGQDPGQMALRSSRHNWVPDESETNLYKTHRGDCVWLKQAPAEPKKSNEVLTVILSGY